MMKAPPCRPWRTSVIKAGYKAHKRGHTCHEQIEVGQKSKQCTTTFQSARQNSKTIQIWPKDGTEGPSGTKSGLKDYQAGLSVSAKFS